MKTIVVPVADRPECINALNVAFELANRLDANLIGCHIRKHRDSDVSLSSSISAYPELGDGSEEAWVGKSNEKGSKAAKQMFSKIAANYDYPVIKKARLNSGAVWTEKVGAPAKVLSNIGPVSDLIVVSRPKAKGGKLAQLFMISSLMYSSQPVLVLPQKTKKSIGQRISIAWNQSPEAAHAVRAAMPLLEAAEAVNIITIGSEAGVGPKSAQLAQYLSAWGIKTKRVKASGSNDAKAILNGVKDTNSDLLVMGAYSRSRMRQSIFGGVTEHMLQSANIPIFMLHK